MSKRELKSIVDDPLGLESGKRARKGDAAAYDLVPSTSKAFDANFWWRKMHADKKREKLINVFTYEIIKNVVKSYKPANPVAS
jgi:hypothetical protein